ncbi:hypothetical protein GE21DRAFT_8081 [Neurospora crassa]|uniref:Uncharacterized protein n=2 Tax=Neurospora crassa (strain ATCC 24698 / 74-OR23-1A / CBS 708.71 / DSM 1257 / FGSC 987) TaxID=367110 RepID=V5IMQ1_NEUCR|nr:hypothetical protein NCU17019 [Neurospora crassa OR74A]ESA42640.1 hypothetical protein NCU17019 [Neurospora crassa OR74A]KHE87431.1 hypothetical protein GE21DRAFT_8081 [Neurospora crassa]|eukprot:XP_011394845.1 hypothetical protein NCU17019 [Neurospora crassa OR74A]
MMRSFTRHRFSRQRVSSSSTIDDMSSLRPCSSTSSRGRDTGFPEPFNGDRNTTLPHPEANLSPNATLGEEDISTERALMRARNSFLKDPTSSPNSAEGFMDSIKNMERMARAARGDVSKTTSDNGTTWVTTSTTTTAAAAAAAAAATSPAKDSESVMSASSGGSGPRRLETPFVNRARPLFSPESPESRRSTKSTGKRAWFARNILGRSP